MKKVLLTGASGFIGRQAIRPLLERGFDVHAVSRSGEAVEKGATWHAADLLDAHGRTTLMNTVRPTHVLHFAWIATPGVYWTSPLNTEWEKATLDLLALSREAGVTRFTAAGTCAEYEWNGDTCNEEKTPLRPSTPYGEAKAETCAAVIAANGAMSTAWGRIFLLYGPHEDPRRLVPSVILPLLRGETARCTHGMQVRDFLHVRDVADAFTALLDSPVTGAVNIASGEGITIRTVVEEIARQLQAEDRVAFGALPAPAGDPARLTASVERLRGELGWRPSFTLETGIADAVAWWRSRGNGAGDAL